jgi:type VI secretion system protein ImpF
LAPSAGGARTLRFVIEGLLRIDPAPEHISFDTTLELTSGEYAVKGDR